MDSSNIDMSYRREKSPLSKKIFFKLLSQLSHGYIQVVQGDNSYDFGDINADLRAQITITDNKAYQRIIWGGSIGAAEAYIEGFWHADSVINIIMIFSRNLKKLEKYEKRFSFISNIINQIKHRLSRNSKSGSRTNIAAHYDISNDMYRMFLDPHMQYSSAIYADADCTLEQAQENKMALICDYLELNEQDHLLEIGTGWGGLACYAAKHYGCQVTTTTISPSQYAIAKERVKEQGLTDKVTLLLEDYRDLKGQFSKVVSIEMIEAVGHKFMPAYFNIIDKLLAPAGKLLIQSITINDQRYDDYCKNVDFIQRYIFPGGHLPSVSLICNQMKIQTNLCLDHFADYRLDYANTLKEWRHRFLNHKSDILALGFSEDFIRLWEFYFCYCEGAFREKAIGLAHLGFIKSEY